MNWRDAVSEGFPPSHEREPGALRQDIADELADHLACAMTRELRRTDDETVAERAVLDRFGNPKAIARRLWWDAMKEPMMKDRLFIVVFAVGLLALVAAFVMPWAAQQQKMNEALLQRLEALAMQGNKSAAPDNWTELSVRVVEESPDGPPVPGVRILLAGRSFQDSKDDRLIEMTDQRGAVSFGPIRPGAYTLTAGGDDRTMISHGRAVTLYAGQKRQIQLLMPKPGTADLSIQLNVPDDLRESSCVAALTLKHGPIVRGDTEWQVVSVPDHIAIDLKTGNTRPFNPRELQPSAPGVFCGAFPAGGVNVLKWPVAMHQMTSMSFYWTGLNGGGLHCWVTMPEYVPDKPIEVHPPAGKSEWSIQFPDQLITAYRKIVENAVPVSFELKPRPKPTMVTYEGKDGREPAFESKWLMLAIRFTPESTAAKSAAVESSPPDQTVVLTHLWGLAVIPDSQIQMGGDPLQVKWEGGVYFPTEPKGPHSSLVSMMSTAFMRPGRYRIERMTLLRPATETVRNGLVHQWVECARFDGSTSGLSDLRFAAEPLLPQTSFTQAWTIDLPEPVAHAINQYSAANQSSTTRPH